MFIPCVQKAVPPFKFLANADLSFDDEGELVVDGHAKGRAGSMMESVAVGLSGTSTKFLEIHENGTIPPRNDTPEESLLHSRIRSIVSIHFDVSDRKFAR
jgi:hypothetical protein